MSTFYPTSYGSSVWTNPEYGMQRQYYATYTPPAKNNITYTEYKGFNFSVIPQNAIITSLTVAAVYYVSTTSSIAKLHLSAFKNGVLSGTEGIDTAEPTVATSYTSSTTGSWLASDLANFSINVGFERGNSNTGVTFYLDTVYVNVEYSASVSVIIPCATVISTHQETMVYIKSKVFVSVNQGSVVQSYKQNIKSSPKIMSIDSLSKLYLMGEIVEGSTVYLDEFGILRINKILEGNVFSLSSTGILTVNTLIEGGV